ncbi:MAG: glucosamine-6-phosphate deaminase [Firmicutes bacterium]|nr:glucosamine-6-phosphate deaminase [Bacillota bacterium]
MNLIIVKDYSEMSQRAAHLVAAQLLSKPDSILGLATGDTPKGLYRSLIKYYEEGVISFKQAMAFNLDEYVGLASEHAQSYRSFMKQNLFDFVDFLPEKCFIPQGDASNPEKEAMRYEALIDQSGGIDLQILGIGRNGHIGFNEPGSNFEAYTHVVELDSRTVVDNARFFDSIEEVPRKAISMGIKTIMKSKKIILLASGASKGEALYQMMYGKITPELPASVLQLHPNVTVICDEAASEKLLK